MTTPTTITIPASDTAVTRDEKTAVVISGFNYLGLKLVRGPGYRITINGVSNDIFTDYVFKVNDFTDVISVNTLGCYHNVVYPLVIKTFGSSTLFNMG